MQGHLPVLIALLGAVALVSLIAPRLRLPPAVLWALSGVGIALIPGLPEFSIPPELILLLFLPPLLYADAFDASWVDFRRWLRPILMLATGLVAFTIAAVSLVAQEFLPSLTWVACFTLGAIVSPTDTVATASVIERVRIPRRMTSILSGESLVNDATALVGVQLGVALAGVAVWSFGAITREFAFIAGGGIVAGACVGVLFSWANRFVRETSVLFVLSLIAPYLAFLVAHALGASGVLAVVVAGFIVSWRIHAIPPAARVDLYATWKQIVYVLNGLCFVFIGVEAPRVIAAADELARPGLLGAGFAIAGAVIATRILWCFPVAYLPLWLSPRLRRREGGYPRLRGVFIVSWCGVRGAVSLAAALALPETFPGRTEILACTLIVILTTLVGQGMTLLPLIRWLGIRADDDTEDERRAARESVLKAGIARLDAFCSENSCPLAVHHLRALMADELTSLRDEDEGLRKSASVRLSVSQEVRRAVAITQEAALLALRDRGTINDRTYIELQLELDRANPAVRSPTGR